MATKRIRCNFHHPNGQQCKHRTWKDGFCYYHHPDSKVDENPPCDLESLRHYLTSTLHKAQNGIIDSQTASTIVKICKELLRIYSLQGQTNRAVTNLSNEDLEKILNE